MMEIQETVLSGFVNSYVLNFFSESYRAVFQSPVIKLLFFSGAVAMFLFLSLSFLKGSLHNYVVVFFLAWMLLMPIGRGFPLFFVVIDGLSTAYEKFLMKVVVKKILEKTKYPPNFVFSYLTLGLRERPLPHNIQKKLIFASNYCVPAGTIEENGSKRPISAVDIFSINSQFLSGKGGTKFPSSIAMRLKNREIKKDIFNVSNCFELIATTMNEIRSISKSDLLKERSKHIKITGPMATVEPKLENLAINLNSLSKVQKTFLDQYYSPKRNFLAKAFVNGSDTEGLSPFVFGRTESSYLDISTSAGASFQTLARKIGTDDFFKTSSALGDINNTFYRMPYIRSVLKIFLTIIFLFIFFTPIIFGSFKWCFLWGISYVLVSSIYPILTIFRFVFNSIVYHAARVDTYIKDVGTTIGGESYFSIISAQKILEDISLFSSIYIQFEGIFILSMFGIFPILGMFINKGLSFGGGGMLGSVTSILSQTVRYKAASILSTSRKNSNNQEHSSFSPSKSFESSNINNSNNRNNKPLNSNRSPL